MRFSRFVALCSALVAVGAGSSFLAPESEAAARLLDLAIAAVLGLGAWGQGSLLLSRILPSARGATDASDAAAPSAVTPAERHLFAFAAGLGLVSVELFALALLHLWTRPVFALFALLVLLPALLAARRAPAHAPGPRGGAAPHPLLRPDLPAPTALLLAAALVPHVLTLAAALAPPLYFDVLVYHLALPSLYLLEGGWVATPDFVFSGFPQVMEFLFGGALGLGGVAAPSLLVWSTGAGLLAAVFLFARRFLDVPTSLVAAATLSASTAFLLLVSDAYVDVPLAFFSFLCLHAALASNRDPGPGHGWAVAAGLMAGLAFGTKYTGGVSSLFGAVILLAGPWRARRVASYIAAAALAASPWWIRNLLVFGNPVFPFATNLFAPLSTPMAVETATRYFHELYEYGDFLSNMPKILVLPLYLATGDPRFGGGFDVLGNYGWTLPLTMLFLGLLSLRPFRRNPAGAAASPPARFLFLVVAAHYVAWVATKPVSRFLLPCLPFLCLAGAVAWQRWSGGASRAARAVALGFLIFVALGQFLAYGAAQRSLEKIPVGLGLEPREAYLPRKLDNALAHAFINTRLPSTAVVCVFGDARTHYLRRRFVNVPVFARHPLVAALEEARSVDDVLAWARARGVTHILVNDAERARTMSYGTYGLSAAAEARWEELTGRRARLIHRDSACRIYELTTT